MLLEARIIVLVMVVIAAWAGFQATRKKKAAGYFAVWLLAWAGAIAGGVWAYRQREAQSAVAEFAPSPAAFLGQYPSWESRLAA